MVEPQLSEPCLLEPCLSEPLDYLHFSEATFYYEYRYNLPDLW